MSIERTRKPLPRITFEQLMREIAEDEGMCAQDRARAAELADKAAGPRLMQHVLSMRPITRRVQ